MSDTKAAILTALKQLDPANADHWTSDGLPRLDVLAKAMKVSNVKRGDVTEAAPHFTKDNPTLEAPTPPAELTGTSAQGASSEPTAPAEQAQEQTGEGEQAQEQGDDPAEGEDDAQAADADDATDPARQDDELDDDISDIGADEAELDEAETAVLEAEAKLEEVQAAAVAIQKEVSKLQAERDRLITIRDANKRPHQDMEDRLVFIRRQAEMRAHRAGVAAEALKGVDLTKLDPRSPIDRSMARKTGFGHRPRPQVPLKKGE